ncbi:TetR/AcrR family transcriptional regulator [Nocardioides deserti]|uniref:TetR/AcrR family transcriptional regulator n=1 Tax=Nocardioides deserti TaxID=1588644 RepID=A0ABR6UA30_9ACTN|nr:TetR/AcrR family transcriptional regulator [Nocardioides deserti]MBC2960993.1 TetR/AcrR family transcriptional regulator [Nocardioides deserti]GGO76039.1 putative regulatory protein, TetR [Nocardioides deserti]
MPRISAGSLQEHRADLRRRVFDAFAELMGERSYDAVTMAAIAERAGLGRTTIYHHFPDKAAVVVAFASDETERYVARLTEVLGATDDPVERLRTYVRHHLAADEEFHLGLGPRLFAMLSDEARREIRSHVVAVEDVLRSILLDGHASGRMLVEDVETTLPLVHACLSPRHLPARTIETFVLRAVGAAGP